MNYRKWLTALMAVAALALVAGCGSSDSTSSTASTTSDTGSASTTSSSTTSPSGGPGDATAPDFKNAGDGVVNKLPTAGQSTAQQGCARAPNALQQCPAQPPATGGTAG